MSQLHVEQAIFQVFGVTARPAQLALIRRTLAGQSSLGIMPTGAGKSLAFQATAALIDGTVLVISPLLSLMRDQVEKLHGKVRVARLDASLERREADAVLDALRRGQLDLLYVAPERLSNERFLAALSGANIAALAIDEAHCISAWGHDFRPDYLRLPILIERLRQPPVLALTATAPPAVQRDIMADLRIPADGVVNTGARRPNLALRVEVVADRERRVRELILEDVTAPTIVYALRQADTERLAAWLVEAGINAAAYHAGLEADKRSRVQDQFLYGDVDCVVATVAFGMGVDKPDVRRVIHAHAPRSVEGYVQEVGRAGRDGLPATGTLLYDAGDPVALANFTDARAPDGEQIKLALNTAFAPANREAPDIIAFSPQTVGDGTDVDPATVRTLFARLERMGIVEALTPAFDEYQVGMDYNRSTMAQILTGDLLAAWEAALGAGRKGRLWITVSAGEAARESGTPVEMIRRALRLVEESGAATVRPSGTLQRFRVRRRPDRDQDLPVLLAAAQDTVAAEHARLAAVRSYALERECRQAHVLRFLGEDAPGLCGICDMCAGMAPIEAAEIQPEDWRRHLDPAAVRSMATKATPDPVGIARALCRITSPRSRPHRRHAAWGTLDRAPYPEVLRAVEQLLGVGA